jgi:hypothetical protein
MKGPDAMTQSVLVKEKQTGKKYAIEVIFFFFFFSFSDEQLLGMTLGY